LYIVRITFEDKDTSHCSKCENAIDPPYHSNLLEAPKVRISERMFFGTQD